jgi:ABC-type polar amino acid transport system ATPase subunit
VEQNSPGKIFTAPKHPRTARFLARIIEAGRL